MTFFNNAWFVGIAGGIISGFIVFIITNFIVNKINKKDYYKSVKEVNFKISKMLIMSISEGKIPSPQVVDSLLSSLAKRNNLQLKDINSAEETYNDLITELFETNFIPIDRKQTLANELIQAKDESLQRTISLNENENKIADYRKYKSNPLKYRFSMLLLISSVYIVLIVFLLDEKRSTWLTFSNNIFEIMTIALSTFSLVIVTLTYLTAKITSDKKRNFKKRKKKKSNYFSLKPSKFYYSI